MQKRRAKVLGLFIGGLLGGVVADIVYDSYLGSYHGYLPTTGVKPLVVIGILLGCVIGYRVGAYRSSSK